MHETTQISYELGTVNIILNSESRIGQDAPNFRFTDYDQVLYSCFTPKELEQIAEGGSAELIFNLIMKDPLSSDLTDSPLSDFAELPRKIFEGLTEGVYMNLDVYKTFGNMEQSELEMFYENIDFQLDIPLSLIKENREYFIYSDFMGSTELFEDIDKEIETISINTNAIGTSLLLYREMPIIANAKVNYDNSYVQQPQYLCVIGIIALILLWKRIDFLHKKE
ncbi:hypothetical protein [Butyrivibrio hungatei]|uniref:hypothetical protein n=1 Tax=Butyrivibrio hungatei TaxID=185008 RepID=UPI0004274B5E|nr:hypothetical protein [Butyrivibrio hungatei]